jgi:hypothetical protein
MNGVLFVNIFSVHVDSMVERTSVVNSFPLPPLSKEGTALSSPPSESGAFPRRRCKQPGDQTWRECERSTQRPQ